MSAVLAMLAFAISYAQIDLVHPRISQRWSRLGLQAPTTAVARPPIGERRDYKQPIERLVVDDWYGVRLLTRPSSNRSLKTLIRPSRRPAKERIDFINAIRRVREAPRLHREEELNEIHQ